MLEAASPLIGLEDGLPHLSGPSAVIRQVLAAHFLRDCAHVVEIGGHVRPITSYLTHTPSSVLSIDPKTPAFEAGQLNGHPCRVRHIPRKFQEIDYNYASGSYGLVLLGYSLKPFGRHEPLGRLFYSLIDNARVVVVEYAPALERASSQIPAILGRPNIRVHCRFELLLDDEAIAGSPFARRLFYVLHPSS